jgi:hypothetical protein
MISLKGISFLSYFMKNFTMACLLFVSFSLVSCGKEAPPLEGNSEKAIDYLHASQPNTLKKGTGTTANKS